MRGSWASPPNRAPCLLRRGLAPTSPWGDAAPGLRPRSGHLVSSPLSFFMPKLNKLISIYILRLENERFYVGQSYRPYIRILAHLRGEGSVWTRQNKVVEVIRIFKTHTSDFEIALEIETSITLQLIEIFGFDYVRGGKYVCFKSTS